MSLTVSLSNAHHHSGLFYLHLFFCGDPAQKFHFSISMFLYIDPVQNSEHLSLPTKKPGPCSGFGGTITLSCSSPSY